MATSETQAAEPDALNETAEGRPTLVLVVVMVLVMSWLLLMQQWALAAGSDTGRDRPRRRTWRAQIVWTED